MSFAPILAYLKSLWNRWTAKPSLGRRGEQAAARFLKREGYTLIAHSQREKIGEIDIIAVDNRTLVFVEVKTRKSGQTDHPAEAVTADKQRRLTRLALAYLRRNDLLEHSARFDVIAVSWPDETAPPIIEHLPNAFAPVGAGQMFS